MSYSYQPGSKPVIKPKLQYCAVGNAIWLRSEDQPTCPECLQPDCSVPLPKVFELECNFDNNEAQWFAERRGFQNFTRCRVCKNPWFRCSHILIGANAKNAPANEPKTWKADPTYTPGYELEVYGVCAHCARPMPECVADPCNNRGVTVQPKDQSEDTREEPSVRRCIVTFYQKFAGRYFKNSIHFCAWPNGLTEIELGVRVIACGVADQELYGQLIDANLRKLPAAPADDPESDTYKWWATAVREWALAVEQLAVACAEREKVQLS